MDEKRSDVQAKTAQANEDRASDALEDFLRSIDTTDDNGNECQEREGSSADLGNVPRAVLPCSNSSDTDGRTLEPISQSEAVPAAYNTGYTSSNRIVVENRDQMGPSMSKDIYKVDPSVEAMTVRDVVSLKKRLGIETTGIGVPKPIESFQQLGMSLPGAIMKRLGKLGFLEPTPIQSQAIPVLLQGRNTIIMGSKGSGKTVAYMVPLICQVLNVIREQKFVAKKRRAYCVIMAPTLEGSSNLYRMLMQLLKKLNLRVALIASSYNNYNQVISGTEFLIVTPAKFSDLLRHSCLSLSDTRFIVFEEFAKLYQRNPDEVSIPLSHENATRIIVSKSTLSLDTLRVLRKMLKHSVTVKDMTNQSLKDFDFKWIMCVKEDGRIQKTTILGDLISHFHKHFLMIIFANDGATMESIGNFLNSMDKPAVVVSKEMNPRDVALIMEELKSGKTQIIISNELSLKNAKVPAVNYIVNFDMPSAFSVYCTRIHLPKAGDRTTVYNFLAKQDLSISAHLCYYLEKESLDVPPMLDQIASKWKEYREYKRFGKNFVDVNKEVHLEIIPIVNKGNLQQASEDKRSVNKQWASAEGNRTGVNDAEMDEAYKDSCGAFKEQGNNITDSGEQSQNLDVGSDGVGRQYGIDDELSSDDELDVVPKRQITKSEGLIDLEKMRKRRLRMMEQGI